MSSRLDHIKALERDTAKSLYKLAQARNLRCPSKVGSKIGQQCIFHAGHDGGCMAVNPPELPKVMLRMTGSTMLFDVAIRPSTP